VSSFSLDAFFRRLPTRPSLAGRRLPVVCFGLGKIFFYFEASVHE